MPRSYSVLFRVHFSRLDMLTRLDNISSEEVSKVLIAGSGDFFPCDSDS